MSTGHREGEGEVERRRKGEHWGTGRCKGRYREGEGEDKGEEKDRMHKSGMVWDGVGKWCV